MRSALSRAARKCIVIGQAAAVGAGLGVALLGATEIVTAITAQRWAAKVEDYADFAPILGVAVGVAVGAIAEWIRNRSA